jgi:hypothetical protein
MVIIKESEKGNVGNILDLYKAVIDGKVPNVKPEDLTLVTDSDYLRAYSLFDLGYKISRAFGNAMETVKKAIEEKQD